MCKAERVLPDDSCIVGYSAAIGIWWRQLMLLVRHFHREVSFVRALVPL